MNKLLVIAMILPFAAFGQRFTEAINFSNTGDQTMPLGRYKIGTAIRIEVQISGGWSEDGGIYHIVADWGNLPRVAFRSESSISQRLKFYGYVNPSSNGYAFLFATWDNHSPSESYGNNVKFTIHSEGEIDINTTGSFSNAVELENIFSVSGTSRSVGIGTSTPSEKLEVNGTIRSKEVKVEAAPWPDFVFAEDYQLPSLGETEAYINENKHLPNIPSASEVAENGISLGEMNAKLLLKIEEMTLYMINQDRRIRELETRLKEEVPSVGGEKVEELTLHVIELEKKNKQQDELINKLLKNQEND